MAATMSSGATALLSAISAAGIDVCFANPGTTEMHIVAALDQCFDAQGHHGSIRPVLGLHENVVTGAADGYARMARRPALALLHLGPGLANGLANLHNARRASSPVLVLAGGMASWHESADSMLSMDMAALAATVSAVVVKFPAVAGQQGRFDMQVVPGVSGSRVATLLLPHDASWGAPEAIPAAGAVGAAAAAFSCDTGLTWSPEHPGTCGFIKDCASAIRKERLAGGQVALYLGGEALASEEALQWAGYISSITGAVLLCEGLFSRVERGCGLPCLRRLPYFPEEAQRELQQYSLLITVDAKLPVANFGYKDGPSLLVTHLEESQIWEFDSGTMAPKAMQLLARELGATPESVKPGINCRGVFCSASRPVAPSGKLTARNLCAALAYLQPPGAVIVDESITSGGAYWELSKGCPRFSHLTLTGGAIGIGPALSVGAAVACPDRLVINLQADGSAMYTLQSLWTQAREKLNVITIICDNQQYSILKVECARQHLPPAGPATLALTNIGHPSLDWVNLGRGMGVPSHSVDTCEQLLDVLREAIEQRQGAAPDGQAGPQHGPLLIQARLT